MAEMERMGGRRIGAISQRYRAGVIDPLVTRVRQAKSIAGVLQALGPGLARDMDDTAVADALADTMVQSAMIGRVTALPRQRAKRRNVERSKE